MPMEAREGVRILKQELQLIICRLLWLQGTSEHPAVILKGIMYSNY